MKKAYRSPQILVERFELTQHLASCAISINAQDIGCVLGSSDATAEMKDLAIQGYFAMDCIRQPIAGAPYITFCYLTADGLAFGS